MSGLRLIHLMNKSLLGKWLWCFGVERQRLWRKVIASKFGEVNGWFSKRPLVPYGYSLWKGFYKGADSFANLIFKINNGERTRLWKERWYTSVPLFQLYPNIFALACYREGMVKNFMIRTRSFCSWNLHFRRNLNDWGVEEVGQLMNLLEEAALGSDAEHKRANIQIW